MASNRNELVEALGLQVGRSRVRFPMVSLDFLIDLILPAALWPLKEMSWLRHWVTSRKVASSIPDYVIGIFH